MNCPKCNSGNVALIEYAITHPNHYDGISEIQCGDCNKRYGRWSHRELADGESEGRYGKPSLSALEQAKELRRYA